MPLTPNLEKFKKRADAAFLMYTQTQALKLQNIMRKEAPWQDRTSRARNTLTGEGYKSDYDYIIKLAYGVDYGVFLELAHEKRFAIIQPTIRNQAPDVIADFEKLVDNLQKGMVMF